ncbi:NADH-quinone oxidoreductase subunit C [Rhabdobacter roseus]|uniref:NADH-quinone oxidoreductase subunit C n=1 Tax=Rhabdobacter roseus TaxID=1655419 RepID=A0A840TXN0_9BACT|nr:NADH-quinone oxidoreductase subunit C [Rhabdobacter roseus]MBB5286033.1 NADH-quinone oxidoreductase subunit C [Rhabdobacter roseus]
MHFTDIQAILAGQFGEAIQPDAPENLLQPALSIQTERLADVCAFLHRDERLYFDHLACVTALDNGPGLGTMEVIYNLTSIPYGHNLMLKVKLLRNQPGEPLPQVPTVSHIWRTADWHEREAYDLVGIHFEGHPDLRRILLPLDWEGHPLRRDYEVQEVYHGIRVRYEDRNVPTAEG